MNALKHGLRSSRATLLRDHSITCEERRMRWMSLSDASNDIEEFVAAQNAALSLKLEWLQRAEAEQHRSVLDNIDDEEIDEVEDLGSSLVSDNCGPTPLYGTTRFARKQARTSWNGNGLDRLRPARIVRKLESSARGCEFLLEKWTELKSHLERDGGFWVAADRLTAIRLLGRQPVDAVRDRRVADIFAATNALYRSGKAFDDLQSDMPPDTHERFVKDVRARWKGLVSHEQPEKARKVLIDLIDQNVERIEAQLEILLEESGEAAAERSVDRAGFDDSRRGLLIEQAQMRCRRALNQGIETSRKLRKERTGGRTPGRGQRADDLDRPRRIPIYPDAPAPSRRGREDLGDFSIEWALAPEPTKDDSGPIGATNSAVAGGTEPQGQSKLAGKSQSGCGGELANAQDVGPAGAGGDGERSAATAETRENEIVANDGPAGVGFAPTRAGGIGERADLNEEGRAGEIVANVGPAGAGIHPAGAGGEGERSDLDAEGSESEIATNEANSDREVITSQTEELVEVAANSGDFSGLDTRRTKPISHFRFSSLDFGLGAPEVSAANDSAEPARSPPNSVMGLDETEASAMGSS
jgi:hypothetical protein